MVEMVNRMTGSPMLVAENRVQEYLQQGHRLAKKTVKVVVETQEKKTPEEMPMNEPEETPKQDETPVKTVKRGRGGSKKK